LAEAQLSLVDTKPSKVPWDRASGTLVSYRLTLDASCIKESHQIKAGMRTLWVSWQSAAVALRPIRVR
jgi:hypothetical protein